MQRNCAIRWFAAMLAALAIAGLPQVAAAQENRQQAEAQREQTQPLNNAPLWRDVRRSNPDLYTTTQVRGVDTDVLIESGGQLWRQVRNDPITIYGGWLIVIIFLAVVAFYAVYGQQKPNAPPTGRKIMRFSIWDRTVHWATAITFVILAITGLITLFGKYLLLPLIGYTAFSWLAIVSKSLHNFVGPLFAICTVVMIATFARDNLLKSYDWKWARHFGGLTTGKHVPSGRYNFGEKAWFWGGVVLLGIIAIISGFVLDFANFGQGRVTMQVANVVHAVAAVLFIAMSLGHIYLGTIGTAGAYSAMRNGDVDETWAKFHHEYWYEEVKSGGRGPGAAPSHAPAAPLR